MLKRTGISNHAKVLEDGGMCGTGNISCPSCGCKMRKREQLIDHLREAHDATDCFTNEEIGIPNDRKEVGILHITRRFCLLVL